MKFLLIFFSSMISSSDAQPAKKKKSSPHARTVLTCVKLMEVGEKFKATPSASLQQVGQQVRLSYGSTFFDFSEFFNVVCWFGLLFLWIFLYNNV